ncbi:IS21 family transposase [Sulfurimonas sp. MAG313]|nr:IS21 family transposase [Sulfurimonas sp. MAG313]MDF1881220.1 IS21 family transposase [Sulfurimonas sp. MAG313]MDF1882298.1 IS21 family transposase [Sulfurimonas sp. MAG313]
MSKIKEVLQLKYCNQLSNRQIQTMTGVSRNSVANYLKTYEELRIDLDKILQLCDEELLTLFTPKKLNPSKEPTNLLNHPDWNDVRLELSKKGMTRALLWEELKSKQPNLYGYSQFNRYYAAYLKKLNPSMRQVHYSGDKLFIDYSGVTMPITNQVTGEISKAQIFVTVMAASGLTFAHATATQSTKDFIASHIQAFNFYEGVPNILVPDNLKAAVISHKKGVVRLNDSYKDMAAHYAVAVEPARPYKPQDKSKVELGVKGVQRWILMKLRHHTFFSVDELNQVIYLLLDGYNNKIIKRLGKSRTELFELLDKPHLHPLRTNQYIFKEFKRATVGIDYHVELEGSGYSVPYIHLGKKVDISYSSSSVMISLNGGVIAHHPKLTQAYHDSTNLEHMPPEHQYQYEKWNPKRILNWANSIGVQTTALMESIMQRRSHPTRGYKSCMAILSFSKTYGNEALEAVSNLALEANRYKVSSIESMLKTKTYLLHNQQDSANNTYMNQHENIRGSEYYSSLTDTTTKAIKL